VTPAPGQKARQKQWEISWWVAPAGAHPVELDAKSRTAKMALVAVGAEGTGARRELLGVLRSGGATHLMTVQRLRAGARDAGHPKSRESPPWWGG
jgi:hypothetical protein